MIDYHGRIGAGEKSNVMEALELLRSTPSDFAEAIRDGGGPLEWPWKGSGTGAPLVQAAVGWNVEMR